MWAPHVIPYLVTSDKLGDGMGNRRMPPPVGMRRWSRGGARGAVAAQREPRPCSLRSGSAGRGSCARCESRSCEGGTPAWRCACWGGSPTGSCPGEEAHPLGSCAARVGDVAAAMPLACPWRCSRRPRGGVETLRCRGESRPLCVFVEIRDAQRKKVGVVE